MISRIIISCLVLFAIVTTSVSKEKKRKSWKEKDIRDYTDADMENLLDQWEENEEPLEPDELPIYLQPNPKIDVSKLDIKNPESMIQVTKKGRNVMMFVDLRSDVSKEQAEIMTQIWQTGLQNNHITVERYPIENNRYIFMFHDGSQAIEGKNYLLQHSEITQITVDGQSYYPRLKPGQNFIVDESLKKSSAKTKVEL
ncbi:LDLR chaperone boca [Pogonomyrmex barbatus]|uniref:LDLR chaperone boca n=1 Tax=Pogonomyrmex barbatus TaxID=144034 RepID=A0A6I9WTQ2_9HYME|nr:LDLR chaperone boca [Pogonomyrmex barbatus]